MELARESPYAGRLNMHENGGKREIGRVGGSRKNLAIKRPCFFSTSTESKDKGLLLVGPKDVRSA
jgi:hypothetical protein